MKLPEPVAWIDSSDLELMHKHGRGRIAWGNEQNNAKTSLYSETQLREALASHEAVMRMALKCLKDTEEYLRIEVNEAYARDANINTINDWQLKLRQHREAIKALQEQLK